jgi:hypothetical protein
MPHFCLKFRARRVLNCLERFQLNSTIATGPVYSMQITRQSAGHKPQDQGTFQDCLPDAS